MLVHGAAGNVGAYAVQLAKRAGVEVIATAFTRDVEYVRTLGVDRVIDVQTARFDERAKDVDVVLDTVGGKHSTGRSRFSSPGAFSCLRWQSSMRIELRSAACRACSFSSLSHPRA